MRIFADNFKTIVKISQQDSIKFAFIYNEFSLNKLSIKPFFSFANTFRRYSALGPKFSIKPASICVALR